VLPLVLPLVLLVWLWLVLPPVLLVWLWLVLVMVWQVVEFAYPVVGLVMALEALRLLWSVQ
jgi:hypothetical protein